MGERSGEAGNDEELKVDAEELVEIEYAVEPPSPGSISGGCKGSVSEHSSKPGASDSVGSGTGASTSVLECANSFEYDSCDANNDTITSTLYGLKGLERVFWACGSKHLKLHTHAANDR